MPGDDRHLVVQEFDNSLYPPAGLSPDNAWLGIYQVLSWYEHGYLHIREANDLLKNATWQRRAHLAETYIAHILGVSESRVSHLVDRMMRLPRWQGRQRQNPLGKGFTVLICEVLSRWADPRFEYREEEMATPWFPGITLPGRSKEPRIDVLAVAKASYTPIAVISCKWSIRHDRISDPTNECTAYKSAAVQRQIMTLKYYVVINEMDVQRLDKVVNQPCVDGLVHVRLDLVRQLFGALIPTLNAAIGESRFLDLVDFVNLTYRW